MYRVYCQKAVALGEPILIYINLRLNIHRDYDKNKTGRFVQDDFPR